MRTAHVAGAQTRDWKYRMIDIFLAISQALGLSVWLTVIIGTMILIFVAFAGSALTWWYNREMHRTQTFTNHVIFQTTGQEAGHLRIRGIDGRAYTLPEIFYDPILMKTIERAIEQTTEECPGLRLATSQLQEEMWEILIGFTSPFIPSDQPRHWMVVTHERYDTMILRRQRILTRVILVSEPDIERFHSSLPALKLERKTHDLRRDKTMSWILRMHAAHDPNASFAMIRFVDPAWKKVSSAR